MKGWSWIFAIVAAGAFLALVAFGAFRAGEHHAGGHNDVVRVVSPVDGSSTGVQVVHVDDGHWGFFPGFFFFPLLLVLLFFVFFRWGRWRRGPWGGGPWDTHSFD